MFLHFVSHDLRLYSGWANGEGWEREGLLLYGQGHDACCVKKCQTSIRYTETWILLDSTPQSVVAEDMSKVGGAK